MTSISTSASVEIPRPRDEVFAFATDSSNTPRTIRARGPFPGITKIEMLEGQSLAKGVTRSVYTTDGACLELSDVVTFFFSSAAIWEVLRDETRLAGLINAPDA